MDCSLPGPSVHGILQARILEWVAIPFSRGSSNSRDWTQVSCIAGGFFITCVTREAQAFASIPLVICLIKYLFTMTILITSITESPCWTEVCVAGQLTPSGCFPGRHLSRSGHLQALMGGCGREARIVLSFCFSPGAPTVTASLLWFQPLTKKPAMMPASGSLPSPWL